MSYLQAESNYELIMTKSFLTLLLLFGITYYATSQNTHRYSKSDYLDYQDQLRHHISTHLDSAFIFCGTMRATKVPEYVTYSLAAEAYLYAISGDKKQAKQFIDLAFHRLAALPASLRKTELHATLLNFSGSIAKHQKNYAAATHQYIAGEELAHSINDATLEIRFIHNLADVKAQIGNLREAISETRKELVLLESSRSAFTEENYQLYKSNTLINLGKFYNDLFHETDQYRLLDSAEINYTGALVYSSPYLLNTTTIELNLGGIALTKREFQKAIGLFQRVVRTAKANNLLNEQKLAVYNLAIAYYNLKSYPKALSYFQQSDAFYRADSMDLKQYIQSNYFQSTIYRLQGEGEKAYKHSDIYLENYARLLRESSDEKIDVSEQMTQRHYQQEMELLQASQKKSSAIALWITCILILSALILAVIVYKTRREKRKIQQEVNALLQRQVSPPVSKSKGNSLKIDDETEQELLNRLKKLETDQFYLKPDFTLQTVAKKIKTNTTYLSHIVNKHFHQTFSEYSNDLKIGYVIEQMKTNARYREYSTQAIAESVGFKNAVSFTKSFSKKTGVTPYQFSMKFREPEPIEPV